MAFTKTSILTTKKTIIDGIKYGQIILIPTLRLDKVSIWLEPKITDVVAATSIKIHCSLYAIDGSNLPTGSILIDDYKFLSEITIPQFINFTIPYNTSSAMAIVIWTENADDDNNVSWRYVDTDSSSEELLIYSGSWSKDNTKKFAYRAFSEVPDPVDSTDKTLTIEPGTFTTTVDNTSAEWNLGELYRTEIVGNTVLVNYGNYIVTLVVDQSGSMTWNDPDKLRFDFLKQYATELDSYLGSSNVKFSIIKFRGRRIGKLTINVLGTENSGLNFDGVRIVRKAGSVPSTPSDGFNLIETTSEHYIDTGVEYPITPATTYYYAAFPYYLVDESPLFGTKSYDWLVASASSTIGAANFAYEVYKTDGSGTVLGTGDTDWGYRKVVLSWLNPQGNNYNNVIIVRSSQRIPTNPADGTVIYNGVSSVGTYTDDYGGNYDFPNGLTYYYKIFTYSSITSGKSILVNSRDISVLIPTADRPWELEEAGVSPGGVFDVVPSEPTVTVTESSGELKLEWTGDAYSVRYKVYYNTERYPIALDEKRRSFDGTLIYDGEGLSYIHRFLTNGEPCYYSVVAYNIVENVSLPTQPTVDDRPPKPSTTSTEHLEPDAVVNFNVYPAGTYSEMSWTNPIAPQNSTTYWFDDVVRVVSTVEFIDPGDITDSYITYEFVETGRQLIQYSDAVTIDSSTALKVAYSTSTDLSSIRAVISVNADAEVRNNLKSASVSLYATIRVKNRETNQVISEVKTDGITVQLNNPFEITLENEPQQQVSRRSWKLQGTGEETAAICQTYDYSEESIPGIYVNSSTPWYGYLKLSYRGLALDNNIDVKISIIDKTTGLPSTYINIPQLGTNTGTITTETNTDEVLDRSGNPTGEEETTTTIPLILPPSSVPGDFYIQATADYNSYEKTVQTEVHFEKTLNIDLDVSDIENIYAFIYYGPYDGTQEQKVPVKDAVVAFTIESTCPASDKIKLNVVSGSPVSGAKGVTSKSDANGVAGNIKVSGLPKSWAKEQFYVVSATTQIGGQTIQGYSMLYFSPTAEKLTGNKIFLRNVDTSNFTHSIYADGYTESEWEVLIDPNSDGNINDYASGKAFYSVVTGNGGIVPTITTPVLIEVVPIAITSGAPYFIGASKIHINVYDVDDNLVYESGNSEYTKALIPVDLATGKAIFKITVNAFIPNKNELANSVGELLSDLESNKWYSSYGIKFERPQSSIYLTLSVIYRAEQTGQTVTYVGGGGDLLNSAPPCFIELQEPLRLTKD